MMPLCYTRDAERAGVHVQPDGGDCARRRPRQARQQIMIGDKQECLDTVERYTKAGVTHFIFMMFAPYFVDEIQAFAEEVIPAVRGADARVELA